MMIMMMIMMKKKIFLILFTATREWSVLNKLYISRFASLIDKSGQIIIQFYHSFVSLSNVDAFANLSLNCFKNSRIYLDHEFW